MSLINQLAKLAGVTNHETVGYSSQLTEGRKEEFSRDEIGAVRRAVIKVIKYLDGESAGSPRATVTSSDRKDGDQYEEVLKAIDRGYVPNKVTQRKNQLAAQSVWKNMDTAARDYVFDMKIIENLASRPVIARYFEVELESEEVRLESTNSDSERGHLRFQVWVTFDKDYGKTKDNSKVKWKHYDTFASKGKADTEGKELVKTSSAIAYEVRDLENKKTLGEAEGHTQGSPDPEREGYRAYHTKGKSNPYKKGTPEFHDFERGWEDAAHERHGDEQEETSIKESDEVKMTQLDDEQEALSKQDDEQDGSNKVPPAVFSDIAKTLKEIKFKVEHLSHIDSSYQEHGYWARFIVEMEKIVDMLKQGTDEAFKEVATKLQQFENVALAEVPDSLWKFVSSDMYKPTEKRGQSLSNKFQEVKQSMSLQGLNSQVKGL